MIVHYEAISGIFSQALGNFGYIARHPDLEELVRAANYIQEKKGNA
jgi:hypothetical protein